MSTESLPSTAHQADTMSPVGQCSDIVGSEPWSPFAYPRPTDEVVKAAEILIVDDEELVVRSVRKHLQAAGFKNFQTVSNSEEAIGQISTSIPDLVLLDIRMRPVNGLEILSCIRNGESTHNIPVIILTSATDEQTRITALNLGANDFLTKPVAVTELVARVRNTLAVKAYRDLVTDYSLQLESDVLCDALTGVANRRAFDYELKRRMIEWNRQRTPLSLLMVDIDHFKAVNDRYGHQTGDSVLHAVAAELAKCMRDTDLVVRYGGEEFAIILPTTPSSDAKKAADRVRCAVAGGKFRADGQQIPLTVSVGAATAMNGDDVDLLVRRADAALYEGKRNGRNCSFFHEGAVCVPISMPDRQRVSACVANAANLKSDGVSIDDSRIVIVDDEPATIAVARKYLRDAGYQHFVAVSDATEAFDAIIRADADLVLLDIHMPEVNGLEILQRLRSDSQTQLIPVIIFTSATDKALKVKALDLGANDFLQKPVDNSELLARVRNTLLAKSHLDYLANYSNHLEQEVRLRTSELSASRREAIQCLARAAELRDDQTGQHVLRVGRYAAIIARELGFSEERVTWIEHAAQLHDVGKIGIPDSILNKPGGLTEDEFEIVKNHCAVGSGIIRDEKDTGVPAIREHALLATSIFNDCNSPVMRLAAVVAETHHEKWDGTGYPQGLSGDAIPIEGRITAVADVFDALSTQRHYKGAIPLEQCFALLEENRGSHFDPDVLDAFFRRKSEVARTFHEYADVPVAGSG